MSPTGSVRLGLWGAPYSGKTTFLAALRLATLRQEHGVTWTMTSNDTPSRLFLLGGTNTLRKGNFPEATTAPATYSWELSGDVSGRDGQNWLKTLVADAAPSGQPAAGGRKRVEFALDVVDAPGGLFDDDYLPTASDVEVFHHLITHLATSDGLIFLYDPLRSDNFTFVQNTLELLVEASRERRRFLKGRLVHHLAVCITKFDDPRVFDRAVKGDWVISDPLPQARPQVRDPQGFFESLASDLVRKSLASFFDPRLTRYFFVSAVGFRPSVQGGVDPSDYANVRTVNEAPEIVGEVHPYNILDPLVWLERRVRLYRGLEDEESGTESSVSAGDPRRRVGRNR